MSIFVVCHRSTLRIFLCVFTVCELYCYLCHKSLYVKYICCPYHMSMWSIFFCVTGVIR